MLFLIGDIVDKCYGWWVEWFIVNDIADEWQFLMGGIILMYDVVDNIEEIIISYKNYYKNSREYVVCKIVCSRIDKQRQLFTRNVVGREEYLPSSSWK